MKKILLITTLLMSMFMVFSCKKDSATNMKKDYPEVGKLNIRAQLMIYSLENTGWVEGDKIGVYVTSEGLDQENYEYVPTEVNVPNVREVGGVTYKIYPKDSKAKEMVTLKPSDKNKEIGFKKGRHTINTYYPYSSDSKDIHHVVPPCIISQDHNYGSLGGAFRAYTFAFATLLDINKYKSLPLDMGEFKPLYSQLTIPKVVFPQQLVGKSCSKIVISSDNTIAYEEGATVDLNNGVFSGKASQSVTYNFPNGIILKEKSGKVGVGPLYIMVASIKSQAKNYKYSISCMVDGKEYKGNLEVSERTKEDDNNIIINPVEVQ